VVATALATAGVGASEVSGSPAEAGSRCVGRPAQASLYGVAAQSASDVWAVGSFSYAAAGIPDSQTLVEHWDGSRWCRVASPSPGTDGSVLQAVTAVSPVDAWAVGYDNAGAGGGTMTLIEHWDGTSWSQVSSPDPSEPYLINYLFAVTAQSPTSIWAVGNYATQTGQQSLILDGDGTSWEQVTAPSPQDYNYLRAVAATRFGAWAAGNSAGQTFTLKWSGGRWSQSASPIEPRNVFLSGLVMTSRSVGWAVGSDNSFHQSKTLILRGDGVSWSKVASPSDAVNGSLAAVTATSAANAWAVGSDANAAGTSAVPMILHWNGKSWKEAASPDPHGSAAFDHLYGVAASSRSSAWAVGTWSTNTTNGAVILRWNGTSWKPAAPRSL
jgi:hypothetical protein